MKKKILIIIPERLLAQAFSDHFIDKGFETKVCNTFTEGMQKVKEFKPDLVLLDIALPDGDGISIIREIKQNPESRGAAVIVITNEMSPERKLDAVKARATIFMVQSKHSYNHVINKIEEILKLL